MDLDSERAFIISELQKVNDITILAAIRTILVEGLESEDEIDVEQYNKELDEANARIEKGQFIPHDEALNRIEKWIKKGD